MAFDWGSGFLGGMANAYWNKSPRSKPKTYKPKKKKASKPVSLSALDRQIARKNGPIKVKTVTKKRKDGSTYKAGKVVKAKRKEDKNYAYHTPRPKKSNKGKGSGSGSGRSYAGAYAGGGGGGGGGGGSSSKSKSSKSKSSSAPKTTANKRQSIYGSAYKDLDRLMQEYRGIQNTYNPGEFNFREFEGMDSYANQARDRVDSDIASNVATLGSQREAANRAYEQALGDINLARGRDVQGVNADEQQALGRLQAMSANMGMGAGQGALANNMGVVSDYQNNRNQVYQDYARQQSENAMNRANNMSDIAGQEASMRAGRIARMGELGDQLGQAGWERYMGERGQKFGEWGKEEDLRYQKALDDLEAKFGSLAGQEGIIGSRVGLKQDERNYLFNELWRNKDFEYAKQQDAMERAYRDRMENAQMDWDKQSFNKTFNFNQAQADRNYNMYLKQLEQTQAYNPYDPRNW